LKNKEEISSSDEKREEESHDLHATNKRG